MFDFSLRAVVSFLIVSVAWIFGSIELYHVVTDFTHHWYWLLSAFLYTAVLNELFCHLIISHNYFPIDTNSITYKVLIFLTSIDHAYGDCIGFAQVHSIHHIHPDVKGKDPLYIKNNWFTTNIISPLVYLYQSEIEIPSDKFFQDVQKKHKDLINDDWTIFCENYKIPLTLLVWGVLYLICPIILFKVIFLGRILMSLIMLVVSIGTHNRLLVGTQNYKNNTTYNNYLFHYLFLGLLPSVLHNNHHNGFTAETHSNHWYEIDLGSMIITYILKPLLVRRD